MATYNDVLITSDWKDVFSGAGFTAGTGIVTFQNKGFSNIILSFTESAPDNNNYGVMLVSH